MEILLNKSYGGFYLEKDFCEELKAANVVFDEEPARNDAKFIAYMRESGRLDEATVVEIIPQDAEWHIEECDGYEGLVWDLPRTKIMDQMSMILRGKMQMGEADVVTQDFIQSGLSVDDFAMIWRNNFLNTME